MDPRFFQSGRQFGKWLERHHRTAAELLVGFHRKAANRGMTYQEALDQALAFGWIDGVRKRLDQASYTIRFTPRKRDSIWSAVNIRRVRELEARGLMREPGLEAFRRRDERKTRQYSYEREHAVLDPAMDAALRGNVEAAAFFDAQPPGYRRVAAHWIMSARREETRARRLAHLIERSSRGRRIDLLAPGK